MRWLFLANAVGVASATVYAGMVASSVWIPWYAIGAGAVFIAALAVPWVAEYRSMNREFGAIEDDFLAHGRPDRAERPKQEVFGGADTAPGFRTQRPPVGLVAALFVIGLALLAADVIQWMPLPTAPEDDRSLGY
jgi:hypothetical protein